ncbi:CAP10 [Geosmithia morbida]|uniref:CAP10 n=1 Tax=Geosmithia morbida TaxID=1094350 RepID=A0A9P5D219_9HYPO|nr:CAP10 [Geosmithia morbida]KAF4121051.1 CAP10 [Geosmithia morbida]
MIKAPRFVPGLTAGPSRLLLRYIFAGLVIGFVVANYVLWRDTHSWSAQTTHAPMTFGVKHPIKKLMREARDVQADKLSRRSFTLRSAAERYREARGRHPPPGFDRWMEAALEADSVVVEDYYDRIYKDLAPWWAKDAESTRRSSHAWPWLVRVRNGTAAAEGDVEGRVPWLQLWTGLVADFAHHLPDVDMPINYMDEPRLLVPHDEIARLLAAEQAERTMPPPGLVTAEYPGLSAVDAADPAFDDPDWSGPSSSYWDLAVRACPPSSPAYGVGAVTDYSGRAEFPQAYDPAYAFQGFVRNWTAATDPCEQPHLRQLHGSFVEPISLSSTDELIPLFGGSKLPMNNEILIPGAMYLTDDAFYSGGDAHGPSWDRKRDGVIWRGDASGGRARAETWHHFHRHRMVDMLNATSVWRAERDGDGVGRTDTFELPDTSVYTSPLASRGHLSSWIRRFADVGFVNLCPPGECDFLADHYSILPPRPMEDQYRYKFLPDIDGNSFSARFRGFMRSTSVPLKATIYAEWHDDRLVPWLHFVPLDNTLRDLYPVLEFFAGQDGDAEGDRAAQFIAESGKHWAEKSLRRQDMRLYVWRLLLEWARVSDDNRHALGFVDDLLYG